MVVILFLLFLFLFLRYKNKSGNTKVLLGFYLISSFFSLVNYIYQIVPYEHMNNFAILYYIICLYMLLYPFLKNGQFVYKDYDFSPKLLNIISWILIVTSIIAMAYNLTSLIPKVNKLDEFFELRANYYNDLRLGPKNQTQQQPLLQTLANLPLYVSYLTPICCFYNILKGNNKLGILLLISSFSNPIRLMLVGEREASLVVIANFIFAYYFFCNDFTREMRKKVKLLVSIPFIFLGAFIILMTILRFSDGLVESLIVYIGYQPYNFIDFFDHLSSQTLDGRLNFGYLFPKEMRLVENLNYYVNSPKSLNVFAGIVGSLFLDFGYYTIFVCLLFSILFSTIFKRILSRNEKKLPFLHFFLQIFLYQVLFMGIFYNDYNSIYHIGVFLFTFIAIHIYVKYFLK